MQVKVVKFGGSSLADAEHFRQVASIIKADPARRYVVPSAPGKRFKDDTKVTDMLYSCYEKIRNHENIDELYEQITQSQLYRELEEAQNAVNELMNAINNTITFAITGEMPSSCTHDCSTCGGGCH